MSGAGFPSATQPHMTVVAQPALHVISSEAAAVSGVSRATWQAEPVAVMPRVRVRNAAAERVLAYAVDCRTSGIAPGAHSATPNIRFTR